MCGRFFLSRSGEEIARHFGLREVPVLEPRFNVAPGTPIPLVRTSRSRGERVLEMRHWGLVPAWAGRPDAGARMINARAESLDERPAFRTAWSRRRGLVPADGFYEWREGRRVSQPFAVRVRAGALFAIAALYERWEGADGERVDSCALVTTDANARLRPIHDRMPVIVPPDAYAAWLDPGAEPAALRALLRPWPPEATEIAAVDPLVNDPRNEGPELLRPPLVLPGIEP